MSTISRIGLGAIQSGLSQAAENAQNLSQAFQPESEGDIVGPIVGLNENQRQVEAGRVLIAVGDEMEKTALDILA